MNVTRDGDDEENGEEGHQTFCETPTDSMCFSSDDFLSLSNT